MRKPLKFSHVDNRHQLNLAVFAIFKFIDQCQTEYYYKKVVKSKRIRSTPIFKKENNRYIIVIFLASSLKWYINYFIHCVHYSILLT